MAAGENLNFTAFDVFYMAFCNFSFKQSPFFLCEARGQVQRTPSLSKTTTDQNKEDGQFLYGFFDDLGVTV